MNSNAPSTRDDETINDARRWIAVVLYAIAMAMVEAAVVAYLRKLLGQAAPYPPPLMHPAWLARTEIPRETATLVMLATVSWLAGRNGRTRFAYFLVAFGIWDIFYYVFLVPLTGWPRSVLDWDILFLIPLPWWGPVLAPLSIAALMVAGGTLISQFGRGDQVLWPSRGASLLGLAGGLLALYAFMSDALHAPDWSEAVLRSILPSVFNWPLFTFALLLMSAPIIDLCRQLRHR
jgi:hypothetical protein